MTPYKLVYGHDVVLLVEINLQTIRVAKQNELRIEDYWHGMLDELDELKQEWLMALEKFIRQKEQMAKSYNRRVKNKVFNLGDLVWKLILPFEKMWRTYGKWSPT